MKIPYYLPHIILLTLILFGVTMIFYQVKKIIWFTSVYPGYPPYEQSYPVEIIDYPYRSLGIGIIYMCSIFLLLLIIFERFERKQMKF